MWTSPWNRWAALLGFALGGFFDGILLHQILQWHHLLSLVAGAGDLRMQVLWDGYFHALMYVIAAVALAGLWRTREAAGGQPGRMTLAAVLTGFGVWNLVDIVTAHWVMGLHRVRLDGPDPLTWDLIWLAGFGLVPLALAWMLTRGAPPDAGRRGGASLASLTLVLVTLGAGAWSARPPPEQPFTTVVFAPGTSQGQAWAAIQAADARLVWTDPAMGVVVLELPPERRLGLYGGGAVLVGGAGLPAGCFEWSRA